jgi:hypothetical protein
MATPVEKTHAIYWKTTQDGEKPATISSMAIQTDIVDGTTPPALPSDFKEYNKSTRAGILTEFKTAVKTLDSKFLNAFSIPNLIGKIRLS